MIHGSYDNGIRNGGLSKCLCHANGANGSNSFTDSSPSARGLTGVSCSTQDAQKKFGISSCYFDGTLDGRFYAADAADLTIGKFDFTYHCWIYLTVLPSVQNKNFDMGFRYNSVIPRGENFFISKNLNNATYAYIQDLSGVPAVQCYDRLSQFAITLNTWHHTAMCKQGDYLYLFWDGKLVDKQSGAASVNIGDVAANLTFGSHVNMDTTHRNNLGYVDEFQFVLGRALWNRAFVTPNRAT